MSDFQQEGREPSPEELRQYLQELRGADPAEFVAQAFNILATGAQAKLGLDDARVLIDGMGGLVEAIADQMPEEVATPMRNGVVQLKTAQVQAEQELANQGATGAEAPATPAGQPGAAQPAPGQTPAGQGGPAGPGGGAEDPNQKMTDRLWIPGKQPPGA